METVLTVATESEIQIDLPPPRQSSKLTGLKKRSTISSNGHHPRNTFISSRANRDMQDHSWEAEGWRYIEKLDNEGQVQYERVPLTRYELLHPQEDYTVSHATPHSSNAARICSSIRINLRGTPKARVFRYLRTDLNLAGIEPVSPDISVVFGVSKERIWSTFNCQEEGIYPSVIFEVTSPGTRENDFEEKYEYYCRAGIPYYVILDIEYGWDGPNETATYHLHVFEQVGSQYEEMRANSEGKYWLPSLNMWVGVGDQGILIYDETEKLLPTPEELKQALDETEQQRDVAQERIARQETAYAAEQEQLAQQEAARATEQERIAQDALQAQLAAEVKVAELLAQMAELQAKSS